MMTSFKDINICDLYSKNIFGNFKAVTENFKKLGCFHECPYKRDQLFAFNLTFDKNDEHCFGGKERNQKVPIMQSGIHWPDGDYLFKIDIFNKNDLEGFTVKYYYNINNGDKSALK
jgi:hypothetical protein